MQDTTQDSADQEALCGELILQDSSGHKSILEAIQEGEWDFEPVELEKQDFSSTVALPGSEEKLSILAERARSGLPLWHDDDRRSYDDGPDV